MHTPHRTLSCTLAALILLGAAIAAQTPAAQDPAADLLKQGQQMMREGKHAEALAAYRQAIAAAPDSLQANTQAGVVLDLMGQYAEARKYFAKAGSVAKTDQEKTRALRNMAMSYAFESDCPGAVKYASQAFDIFQAAKDAFNSGEVANELARVCLESGDVAAAQKWYQTGYTVGLQEPNIAPARKDLWEFRWEHAQARLAARRGQASEAQKHVAAAKAILDRGTNPDQASYFPYLAGYVAFYGGDYKTALAELQKGNQNDPFILSLIAQAHEKLGDEAQAKEYYRKILASNAHNPTNAFARPLAKKKLGQG
jgi:tetratricopeptide (TPR) repeat protein